MGKKRGKWKPSLVLFLTYPCFLSKLVWFWLFLTPRSPVHPRGSCESGGKKKCEIAVENVFSFSLSWLSRCFWNVPTSAPKIRLNAAHLSQRGAESRELGNRKDWRLDIMGSDWSLEADVPLPGFHLPARGRGETRIQQKTEPPRLTSTGFK